MAEKRPTPVQVHLPPHVKVEAAKLADAQDIALSAWVRGLIVREIEAQEAKREAIMERRKIRKARVAR